MSRSLQEYHERWQRAMRETHIGDPPWDADVTIESCVIFESAHSTPMGEGATAFPDFGDAVCFYRPLRVPEELEPQEHSSDVDNLLPGLAIMEQSWERQRPELTNAQLRSRLTAAEQALDDLLEELVQRGYRAEMSKRLREIVNPPPPPPQPHDPFPPPPPPPPLPPPLPNPPPPYQPHPNDDDPPPHPPPSHLNNPTHP